MKRKTTKKGFTIIETTLATMFLGVIVLSVANLIIQMTHIYQKSLALRAINSTGQQIVEDMQRKINSADYLYDLDTNHDGYLVNKEIIDNMSKYFREWNVGASNSATDQKQIAGAFCVSDYTYIWNSPIPLKEGDNKGKKGSCGGNGKCSGGNKGKSKGGNNTKSTKRKCTLIK